MRGLIQWWDHVPRAGESYCLKHLHPFELTHEMPASDKHPVATVQIYVAFSLHTFTRDIESGDMPTDHYRDNRETRCFCHERYKHSHKLPTIVREIPTCRALYYSRTKSGHVNYATFDNGDGTTYGVYFDLKRFNPPAGRAAGSRRHHHHHDDVGVGARAGGGAGGGGGGGGDDDRGRSTVLLTVVSAYPHDREKPTEGRIRFNVLLGHALRGTKPHPPPRAR